MSVRTGAGFEERRGSTISVKVQLDPSVRNEGEIMKHEVRSMGKKNLVLRHKRGSGGKEVSVLVSKTGKHFQHTTKRKRSEK